MGRPVAHAAGGTTRRSAARGEPPGGISKCAWFMLRKSGLALFYFGLIDTPNHAPLVVVHTVYPEALSTDSNKGKRRTRPFLTIGCQTSPS